MGTLGIKKNTKSFLRLKEYIYVHQTGIVRDGKGTVLKRRKREREENTGTKEKNDNE